MTCSKKYARILDYDRCLYGTCRRKPTPTGPYCSECTKKSARTKLGRAMLRLERGEIAGVSLDTVNGRKVVTIHEITDAALVGVGGTK